MMKQTLLLWKQERKRKNSSLQRRLVLFFLLVTVSIVLVFAVLLMLFGIDGKQYGAVSEYMQNELTDISNKVEEDFGRLSLLGISIAETVTDSCEVFFRENKISASELQTKTELIEPLLAGQMGTLLSAIDNNYCSGVYILLDATVNPDAENAEFSKTGIFIKRTFPSYVSAVGVDDYYLRGPAKIARDNGVKLLGQWKMEYDISGQEFFIDVMSAARQNPELPISRLYYWTGRIVLKDNSEQGFLLCVPLRTADGTVFGICGVEVSDRMFKSGYCPTASSYSNIFFVGAPKNDDYFCTSEGMIAGNHYLTGHRFEYDLYEKNPEDGFEWFEGSGNVFGGVSAALRLYPSDSVYEDDEWGVAVFMPQEDLEDIVKGSSSILWIIIGSLLVISLLASYFVGGYYLRPVTDAFDSIKNRTYKSAETGGYAEIDDLFEFLSKKDKEHEEELSSLHEERQTAQKEHEKIKSELSRLADRKKQEIDPESYRIFIEHLHTLTPKEREVFNLYLDGKSAKEIVALMGFTDNALKYHNKNIYSKLGVPSRKVLLQYAAIMKQEENK